MADFDTRKARYLEVIESPVPDASPKGSVDTPILPLLSLLNSHPSIVTTSSCSGRISIFLDGDASRKGSGGRWLFVSHYPAVSLPSPSSLFNLPPEDLSSQCSRFIHLKFEPMLLHVLTRSVDDAATHGLLAAAVQAGFRESGILAGVKKGECPLLAIRTQGLSLDAPIALVEGGRGEVRRLVDDKGLGTLVELCNGRFNENKERMGRLEEEIRLRVLGEGQKKKKQWERKEERRERLKREGLERKGRVMRERDKKARDDARGEGSGDELGGHTLREPGIE